VFQGKELWTKRNGTQLSQTAEKGAEWRAVWGGAGGGGGGKTEAGGQKKGLFGGKKSERAKTLKHKHRIISERETMAGWCQEKGSIETQTLEGSMLGTQ